ncbi:MAG: hypothetical protein V4474_02320 [Patescibacteria group bacterium]
MGTGADYRLSTQMLEARIAEGQRLARAKDTAVARGYMRAACPECGNCTMVDNGEHWKCATCGEEGDN